MRIGDRAFVMSRWLAERLLFFSFLLHLIGCSGREAVVQNTRPGSPAVITDVQQEARTSIRDDHETPPSVLPSTPPRTVSTASRETTPTSETQPTLPEKIAAEIRGRYAYSVPSPEVLLVKRSGKAQPVASLYEQAIALGNLRSRLLSRSDLPDDVYQNVRLRDGQATIPFGRKVSPDKAADAIVTALSVDGVQTVKAVF